MSDTIAEPPPQIPQEWLEELQTLDPRSHEYGVQAAALGELAAELLGVHIDLSRSTVQISETKVPPGYRSAEVKAGYVAHLPISQFEDLVFSLNSSHGDPEVPVQELETDTGKKIRVCDLRPLMSSTVRKSGPTAPQDIERLDEMVMRDLRRTAETGLRRNTLGSSPKVAYTKFLGTKIRAYWMAIKDVNNQEGVPTYARLADCGNSRAAENSILRAAFHTKLET